MSIYSTYYKSTSIRDVFPIEAHGSQIFFISFWVGEALWFQIDMDSKTKAFSKIVKT